LNPRFEGQGKNSNVRIFSYCNLARLKAFLFADKTAQAQFLPGFCVCGGFAEKVHNNAEAAAERFDKLLKPRLTQKENVGR